MNDYKKHILVFLIFEVRLDQTRIGSQTWFQLLAVDMTVSTKAKSI